MKRLLHLALFSLVIGHWPLVIPALRGQTFPTLSGVSVSANADGTLRAPATFWTANAAALSTALSLAGTYQPLDSDLTAIAALSTTSYGRATLGLADAAAGRTYFGLVIGTDVQAFDSDLASIAALSTTSFGRSLLTQADASALRTTAGLVIGTDVQAYDSDLALIAALATTSYGRATLSLADAAAGRTYFGLVIGTDVQAFDSDLASIAALSTTSFGRSLLTQADASATRTTLGLGSLATQSGTFSGTSSGTNTGDQTISITGDGTASGSTGALTLTVTKLNGTTLSGLATGLLKNTTSTGVPSIATAGTDYVAPGGALGTPSSGTLTNATGLPLASGVTGILPASNGGTGVANSSTITLGGNLTTSGAYATTITTTGTTTVTFPTTGTLLANSRTITATAPVTIDGGTSADLSANRTIAVSAATTSAAGVSQLATTAEVLAGTDAAKTLTPSTSTLSAYQIQSLYAESINLNALGTFSRGSTAYDPWNECTAASGAARKRTFGLAPGVRLDATLIEDSRTNLLLYSNDVSNAAWTKSGLTVTLADDAGPDGTLSAAKIAGDGTNAEWSQGITVTAGRMVNFSLRVLASDATAPYLRIRITSDSDTNGAQGWINLATMSAGSSAALGTGSLGDIRVMRPQPNSRYYTVIFVAKTAAAATSVNVALRLVSADNVSTVASSGQYMHCFGHQAEAVSINTSDGFSSAYIATTSATVTRSADGLSFATATVLPQKEYGLRQGTVIAFFRPLFGVGATTEGYIAGTGSGGDSILFSMQWFSNQGQLDFTGGAGIVETRRFVRGNNPSNTAITAQVSGSVASSRWQSLKTDANGLAMMTGTWDSAGTKLYLGPTLATTNATATPLYNIGGAQTTYIGAGPGGYGVNGWVLVLYWPRALTATEVAAIASAAQITL